MVAETLQCVSGVPHLFVYTDKRRGFCGPLESTRESRYALYDGNGGVICGIQLPIGFTIGYLNDDRIQLNYSSDSWITVHATSPCWINDFLEAGINREGSTTVVLDEYESEYGHVRVLEHSQVLEEPGLFSEVDKYYVVVLDNGCHRPSFSVYECDVEAFRVPIEDFAREIFEEVV